MAEKISIPGDAGPEWGGVADPTLEAGQTPKSLFGMDASGFYETGAQGTAGASAQPEGDQTTQPGQYPATEPISGVTLSGTGSPGGPGANPSGEAETPGQTVMITDPNYTAGRPGGGSGNQFIGVPVAVGGGGDSTTVPGQYDSGVPNAMPAMAEPAGTGAGKGSVLHGGFMNGKRS